MQHLHSNQASLLLAHAELTAKICIICVVWENRELNKRTHFIQLIVCLDWWNKDDPEFIKITEAVLYIRRSYSTVTLLGLSRSHIKLSCNKARDVRTSSPAVAVTRRPSN